MDNTKISITKLLTVSAITGLLIGILKMGFNGFCQYIGLVKRFGLQDGGTLVFKTVDYPKDLFHLSIAGIVYLSIGCLLAIVIGFILLLTGSHRSIFKGAFIGFMGWLFFRQLLIPISLFNSLPTSDAMTVAIVLLTHLLWGGTTGYIITKYIPFKKDVYV